MCLYTYMFICTYIYIYGCVCMYTDMYIYIYKHMFIFTYIKQHSVQEFGKCFGVNPSDTHTHTCTRTHTHTHTHTHMQQLRECLRITPSDTHAHTCTRTRKHTHTHTHTHTTTRIHTRRNSGSVFASLLLTHHTRPHIHLRRVATGQNSQKSVINVLYTGKSATFEFYQHSSAARVLSRCKYEKSQSESRKWHRI